MKVLILHDLVPEGAPPDQLDTLVQVAALTAALPQHAVQAAPFDADAPARIQAADLVINLVETVEGDGKLQHQAAALLEVMGVPFTGNGGAALAVAADKRLSKQLLAACGIATAPEFPLGGPQWIIKSRFEDASIGITDANVVRAAEVPDAVARLAPALGGQVLVETYIPGREVNVALLETADGPVVLPIAQIAFNLPEGKLPIVGYAAKWEPDSEECEGTPRSFDPTGLPTELLRTQSLAVFHALKLGGYARVDWRVPPDGPPILLEVNGNPCLSPDAGYLAAADQAGLTLSDVLAALFAAAFRRAGLEAPQ